MLARVFCCGLPTGVRSSRKHSLSHVLLAATDPRSLSPPSCPVKPRAARALAAEHVATEKTYRRVRQVFASSWAPPPRRLLDQGIVILWQTDELENAWMAHHGRLR